MLQHASMPSIARQNLYVGAQYLQWVLNLWANEVNQKINILQVVCLELGVLLNMGRFYHFYRDGAAMVLACLGNPRVPRGGSIPPTRRCSAEFEKPSWLFMCCCQMHMHIYIEIHACAVPTRTQTHIHTYIYIYTCICNHIYIHV